MSEYAIELNGVSKRYGTFTAVDDLSFRVAPGEIYGFLGPNGAGKTSTLRMMLDIIKPSSGEIRMLGRTDVVNIRRRIGYLPEERGLYKKMKAAQSIAYFARLRGVPAKEAKRRAQALLEEFGLAAFAKTKNEALSKGMAQKVQLLATIAHEPELLILDEPFSGLDPINQEILERLIKDQRANGRTIIFSTHVMQHAERLCDRFLILAHGRKRFEGTLEDAQRIFARRIHLRTDASLDQLRALPDVVAARYVIEGDDRDERAIEIELSENGDPQAVLRALVGAGARVSRFEQGGATLHDIFVALAGEQPADAAAPLREAAE